MAVGGLVDNLNRNMLNIEAETVVVNKNNEIVNIGREEDASSQIRNALDLKENMMILLFQALMINTNIDR